MEYGTMDKKNLFLSVVAVYVYLASGATHTLQYFYTAFTPGIDFPEFTTVGLLDGQQFVYYDSESRKIIPKTEWMKKNEDEDYWDRETQKAQRAEQVFSISVETLMQRFNQTEGVHTVQVMYGCELDDDGTVTGYRREGYDGEDFLSLDMNTETYTAAKPQAVLTKLKLDGKRAANHHKAYLLNECTEWLQKYMGYSRDTLERKVPPEADLFQRDSSSPLVCLATGFFPKALNISWKKNGEDLYENVEIRETLPNQDGTFQKSSVLSVSPEDLEKNQYSCVIQHSSLEQEMELQGSERRVLSGGGSGGVGGVIAGGVVTVLLLVLVCVGVFIWKKKQKKNSDFKPVSRDPPDKILDLKVNRVYA